MADIQAVSGQAVTLGGMGLWRTLVFDVDAAGLHPAHPSHDAASVLSTDGVRRVHLRRLRDLGRDSVEESIEKGSREHNAPQVPRLEEGMLGTKH